MMCMLDVCGVFASDLCMFILNTDGNELRESLKSNFDQMPMCELCDTTDDGLCFVLVFDQAQKLNPYLGPLGVISQNYRSDIFHTLWKKKIKKYLTMTSISVMGVIELIWEPVLKQCIEIVEELFSWTLKLDQVDLIFKQYSIDKNVLACEIKSLYQAVQECQGKKATDLKWVEARVVKMQQYWELCSYQDAAVAFEKIRCSLQLTGDFTVVETVAAKVLVWALHIMPMH